MKLPSQLTYSFLPSSHQNYKQQLFFEKGVPTAVFMSIKPHSEDVTGRRKRFEVCLNMPAVFKSLNCFPGSPFRIPGDVLQLPVEAPEKIFGYSQKPVNNPQGCFGYSQNPKQPCGLNAVNCYYEEKKHFFPPKNYREFFSPKKEGKFKCKLTKP